MKEINEIIVEKAKIALKEVVQYISFKYCLISLRTNSKNLNIAYLMMFK